MKPTTLCFVFDNNNRLLLGRKKRGFGVGKWNGFGGKLQEGESFRQCAVRELEEESGLKAKVEDLKPVALLDFRFPYDTDLTHIGYVYFLRNYQGEVVESEEMEPAWFELDNLPYDHMWAGDRTWVPKLLEGKHLEGAIIFGPDNAGVTKLDLIEVESVSQDELRPQDKWTQDLLAWYDINKRELPWRGCGDPYKIWVSEIMSQQTRIEAMKPYYDNWMHLYPNMEALAKASEEEVVHAWQGLGYYSRARNLRLGVKEVVEEYGGQVPRDRKSMESLKGVGSYTAGAILSMAFNQREAAVDGNVLRVYSRLYHISDDILSTKGKKRITYIVETTLPYDRPADFNQALMDFGSAICIPKVPRCDCCPLQEHCLAYASGDAEQLPTRIKKTRVITVPMEVGLLSWKGYYLLHRRPDKGLLRSMWEFPTVEGIESHEDGQKKLSQLVGKLGFNLDLEGDIIREYTHVFSHRKWLMKGYRGILNYKGSLGVDVDVKSLQASLPPDWILLKRGEFADYVWAGPHGKFTDLCS